VFFFQAEDGIRDFHVTGVQTCALPICSFTMTYVFPDCELVPISTALRAAESAGFEVRDVESLREHYALTVEHWRRRLESRRDEEIGRASCRERAGDAVVER